MGSHPVFCVSNPVRVGVFAALVALLSGCAGVKEKTESDTRPEYLLKVETIALSMAEGVNDNWPAPVELVRVEDAALIDPLLEIEGEAWFEGAGLKFLRGRPRAISDKWEVVPGTIAGPFEVSKRGKFAGVLYCGIRTSTPPLRFERDGDVTILINDDGCTLSGGEPSRKRKKFWPW